MADPNCPKCGGQGYYEEDSSSKPYDGANFGGDSWCQQMQHQATLGMITCDCEVDKI